MTPLTASERGGLQPLLDEARGIDGPPRPASALPPITPRPQRHSQPTVSLNSNTPHYFTPPCLSLPPPPEHTVFSGMAPPRA